MQRQSKHYFLRHNFILSGLAILTLSCTASQSCSADAKAEAILMDVIDIVNVAQKAHTHLFLNAARQIVRVEQLAPEGEQQLNMTATLSNIRLNVPISLSAFAYTRPEQADKSAPPPHR